MSNQQFRTAKNLQPRQASARALLHEITMIARNNYSSEERSGRLWTSGRATRKLSQRLAVPSPSRYTSSVTLE